MKLKTIIIIIIALLLFYYVSIIKNKRDYIKTNTSHRFKVDLSLQDNEYFKNKKVIICGLARDIEENLSSLSKNLKTVTELFQDYLIVIVENDSRDNTRKSLLNLKKDFKIVLLGCGIDSSECVMKTKKYGHAHTKVRIQKMIDLRNIYMDYISKISPGEYDFVIMYDFDLGCSIYQDGILNSAYYFNKFPEIEMMGANSVWINPLNLLFDIYPYYDDYALEPKKRFIKYTGKTVADKSDLLEIESAFGGFVIYKFNSICSLKYKYINDGKGIPLCEHVVFNKDIKNKNKFVNPRMIIAVLKN